MPSRHHQQQKASNLVEKKLYKSNLLNRKLYMKRDSVFLVIRKKVSIEITMRYYYLIPASHRLKLESEVILTGRMRAGDG